MTVYANPVTVQIERPGGFDRNGDPKPSSYHDIEGCVWWPVTSNEEDLAGGNAVIIGLMLTTPVGADIDADDLVRFPSDSVPWYVEGDPGRYVTPHGPSGLDHAGVSLTRRRG